jgi:hypothetical protein
VNPGEEAALRKAGLDPVPAGSILFRYKVKNGKRILILLFQGKESAYEISGDALAIFLQDVAKEAG